jgi:uncharacterized membrane protein
MEDTVKIVEIYESPLPMDDERLAVLTARIPVLVDWLQRENDEALRRALRWALLRSLEMIEDALPERRDWCNAVRRLT